MGSGGLNAFWGKNKSCVSGFQFVDDFDAIVNANYRAGSTSVTDTANSNAIHNNSSVQFHLTLNHWLRGLADFKRKQCEI